MEKSRNFEPKSFNKMFRFDGFKFWEADYPDSYNTAVEKASKKKEQSIEKQELVRAKQELQNIKIHEAK